MWETNWRRLFSRLFSCITKCSVGCRNTLLAIVFHTSFFHLFYRTGVIYMVLMVLPLIILQAVLALLCRGCSQVEHLVPVVKRDTILGYSLVYTRLMNKWKTFCRVDVVTAQADSSSHPRAVAVLLAERQEANLWPPGRPDTPQGCWILF